MKIGIYGGSFNPIHFGHTGLANWIINNTDIDEVWLMVSPHNPLKSSSTLEDEHKRLNSAKLAVKDMKNIIVSDFEFTLPRPNYTANTLRKLAEQFPQHEFTLIIGEDNLGIFDQWREYIYILRCYRIFVYPRRGADTAAEEIIKKLKKEGIKDLRYLQDAPYHDISSSEIRTNKKIN